jgi:hypothetical protein
LRYKRGLRIGYTYICVSCNELAHIPRRVFVELLVAAKDENGDVDRAEHRELMRLLEKTAFPLEKGAVRFRS